MTRHLYISAGEISGEQHAARLVNALRTSIPSLRVTGMGGAPLRQAGVETVIDMEGHRVMGFVEVVGHIPFFWQAARTVVEHLAATRPDAVVLVDNPGFHLRLAKRIKKRLPKMPVLYYIAPKAWAWHARRARQLAAYVDEVLCIFPFEPAWFEARGVKATYVGHPTRDAVMDAPDGSALRSELQLGPGQKLVALFPGSRAREVERLLPIMLAATAELQDLDVAFVIAAAPGFSPARLAAVAALPDTVRVVEGRNLELIQASDVVLAKSGTTTLEAALLKTPMVVAYLVNWLSGVLARALVKLTWFSLPNIIADREIVREFFQEEVTPARLAQEVRRLLTDPAHYAAVQADLADLAGRFGTEPAATRASRSITRFLGAHAAPACQEPQP